MKGIEYVPHDRPVVMATAEWAVIMGKMADKVL